MKAYNKTKAQAAHTCTDANATGQRGKNKGGRPKKEGRKARCIPRTIYFDPETDSMIAEFARSNHTSYSTVVYELVANGEVKEAVPQDIATDIRKIAGMANNVNQLAHQANVDGYARDADTFRGLSAELGRLLTKASRK